VSTAVEVLIFVCRYPKVMLPQVMVLSPILLGPIICFSYLAYRSHSSLIIPTIQVPSGIMSSQEKNIFAAKSFRVG